MIPKNRRFIVQSYYHKSILFPSLVSVFLFAILLVFSFTEGHCAQVTLTWDPNSEPDLSGYEVYYGTSSGNYQWNMDVGNVTTYNVNSLDTGITYYFAATAYNTSGYESGYSNEVVYTPPSCTYSINPSSASFPASGGSGSVLVSTQAGCNWGTSAAPSWVTVNSGSGLGNGTMGYMVSPNTGTTRIASLTIAGNVFTMTETGQTPYTITASAGTGGIIFPSGGVSVQSGANQTFTITPNSGYAISSVLVDGVAKGAVSTYTFSAVNTNHTINATFTAIPNYTLTVIKNGTGSGTVSTNPTGTSFSAGTPVTLTATPDANSVFSGWSGGCTGTASTCQVTMNANVSVNATFTLKPYTITASAGTGGGISPLGVVSVQAGVNQTFTIIPNSGYAISSVLVDGVAKGAVSTYTFSAVNTNHTINATFTAIPNYTLTVIKNGTGSGTVSTNPTGTSFSAGTPVTLTATPDANSVFSGWSGGCTGTASTCQVTMNANVSVNATFTLKPYTITASAGTGGGISPLGVVSVQAGVNQTFTIIPNSGYAISSVLVDGVAKGAVSTYTFSAVNTNHTINATFTAIPNYTLTVIKNGTGSGTVSTNPTGTSFSAGTPVTLTATPDANSVFSGWSGGCTGTASTCQVTMNANVSVNATFTLKPYTITASAGTGGGISPLGVVSVQAGVNQTFTIIPNSGYVISGVLVDGLSQGMISTYTFSAVNTNHTINATFTAISNYTLTVIKNGTGSGTVSTNPTGTSFSAGTPVTLTATPDANSVFSGWSGGCTGTASTCQVTMNANVSVNATFSAVTNMPTVATGTAALVPLSSSATLNGTVNPNGLSTTYIFQWGRSTSYGNTTAVTTAGSGTINTAASAKISGLRSYTVYYYRLVATNSAGTTFGANMAFKTKFTGIRK